MYSNFVKTVMAIACLALVLSPMPAKAQSSSFALGLRANTSTIQPVGSVGVFAWVQNNTTSKQRLTTWFTSRSACGTETMISGEGRVTLNPGQGIQVTVGYPIPPDACKGTYEITFHVKSGGKGATESSTSCYLEVV